MPDVFFFGRHKKPHRLFRVGGVTVPGVATLVEERVSQTRSPMGFAMQLSI